MSYNKKSYPNRRRMYYHLIQPVYFLASLSDEWQQETGVKGAGVYFEQVVMNGQRSAGGGSSKVSGEQESEGVNENQRELSSAERSSKGWEMGSGGEQESSGENQPQAVTDSGDRSGWMQEEDEFRLGDGETGDGNILRKPMATDEGEQTDDV